MDSTFFNNYTLNEQKRIKANAVSAYLLIFASFFFLFNKENKYINNLFVKSHTKSALLIHLLFFITYIIFISNGLFATVEIYNLNLNNILASTLSIFLLLLLIYGIYKSNSGKSFAFGEIISTVNNEKIYDLNHDNSFDEKEKLTVILSYIPLVGFLNYAKYSDNEVIQNSTKLNLIVSLAISLLYIFSHGNLADIVLLMYIIFVVFIGITLFSSTQLIQIKLPFIPDPEKKHTLFLALVNYLKAYFGDKELHSFTHFVNEIVKNKDLEDKNDQKILNKLPLRRIPAVILYFPIINFLTLFVLQSQRRYHIINGIVLSTYIIITYALLFIMNMNTSIVLLYLFPIAYGISYAKNKPVYKMPFVYCSYKAFHNFFGKSKDFNKKYNKTEELTLKVEE